MAFEILRRVAPYIAVLAAAILLYAVADRITYIGKAGQVGPDLWPKAVLLLAIAAAVYQIVCIAAACWREQPAFREPVARTEGSYTGRLLLGMGITVAYVALLKVIGFILCTLLYLAAFMYIGRYRRHLAIAVNSLIGTLALVLIFMKLVYISLPMGSGRFATFNYALLDLLGIR
ncbi:hypothetical protein SVA_0817 [Sulfurifustis variabilis]|uniref:DUF1468 domain-containing protein n=1 Tax=Sulfurifustis variabilis TaxID=1675686 RepID=A0A1B4V1M8_9GAMM|nr:tripartite tricarboxylate transporter TctB family protein [Sulfurifustis variabilis]BAU47396.1 hypothetical protein SVA_0817 [Sulfurifustis variabilis]